MNKITLALITLCLSSYVYADEIPGVKKLKEKKDGSYIVKCIDKTKGVISKEESNICVFSKDNDKNRCESENTWSIEQAAEYICK
ncbi:MAG: hypothetical protein V5789_11085 [Colwellia sp.]